MRLIVAQSALLAFCHCDLESKRGRIRRVKYWEIIADNLSRAGWSLGWASAVDSEGRMIWIIDAQRGDGRRFVVHADEKLSAYVGLERQVVTVTFYLESIHGDPSRRPTTLIEIGPHRWGWKDIREARATSLPL